MRIKLKRVISIVLLIALTAGLLSFATPENTATASSNLDSASEWARDEITEALDKGFVPSGLQNNYRNVITRLEFCRLAIKWLEFATSKNIDEILAERGLSRDPGAFNDTSDPDILAAFVLGITDGTSEKQFSPNGQINREQAATLLMRAMSVNGADTSNPPASGFTDLPAASSWARTAINYVRAGGIMQGTGENIFSPKASYTREQSILTFNRLSYARSDIIFNDDVLDITDAKPAHLLYSNNGATVTVSSSVFQSAPQSGDIIMLPPDLHYPGGRAVKVASVDTAGSNTRLQVTEPDFNEVFSNCDFSTTFKPDAKAIADLYNARQAAGIGVSGLSPSPLAEGEVIGNDLTAMSYTSNAMISNLVLPAVEIKGDTDDTITLEIRAIWDGDGDNYLAFNGKIKLEFGTASASWCSPSVFRLVGVDMDIPVTVTTDLSVKGKLSKEWPIPIGAPIIIPSPVGIAYGSIQLCLMIGIEGTVDVGITHEAHLTYGARATVLPSQRLDHVLDLHSFPFPEIYVAVEATGKVVLQLITSLEIVSFKVLTITPEYGIAIKAEWDNRICKNIHFWIYQLCKIEAIVIEWDWLKAEYEFLNEKNATVLDFYFDTDDIKFYEGKCPCDPIDSTWKAISAGMNHSLGVKKDGTLFAWGYNSRGKLGDGTTTESHRPKKILTVDDVVAVSAGNNHSLALQANGRLWAWGANNYGQLGSITTGSLQSLQPVEIMDDVVAISAGHYHTMAITRDRTLWAWGQNNHGQLGDETTTNQRVPVEIMKNVIMVSAGENHTLAITADGSLWAWGDNSSGQLGETRVGSSDKPIKIRDNMTAVSAGGKHSLAIDADGALWAWGRNLYGQVGDDTNVNKRNPTKIAGMDNIVAVSAGYEHSFAIDADGTLWAWGYNGTTQLGYVPGWGGANYKIPAKVTENVAIVSAGTEHSLAIDTDDSLWAWGYNRFGRLGDGSTQSKNVPGEIIW